MHSNMLMQLALKKSICANQDWASVLARSSFAVACQHASSLVQLSVGNACCVALTRPGISMAQYASPYITFLHYCCDKVRFHHPCPVYLFYELRIHVALNVAAPDQSTGYKVYRVNVPEHPCETSFVHTEQNCCPALFCSVLFWVLTLSAHISRACAVCFLWVVRLIKRHTWARCRITRSASHLQLWFNFILSHQ